MKGFIVSLGALFEKHEAAQTCASSNNLRFFNSFNNNK